MSERIPSDPPVTPSKPERQSQKQPMSAPQSYFKYQSVSDSVSTLGNVERYALVGLSLGLVLGYPLSYYLQAGAVRMAISLGDYIAHPSRVLEQRDLRPSVMLGLVVAIAIGATIGVFVGKNRDKNV